MKKKDNEPIQSLHTKLTTPPTKPTSFFKKKPTLNDQKPILIQKNETPHNQTFSTSNSRINTKSQKDVNISRKEIKKLTSQKETLKPTIIELANRKGNFVNSNNMQPKLRSGLQISEEPMLDQKTETHQIQQVGSPNRRKQILIGGKMSKNSSNVEIRRSISRQELAKSATKVSFDTNCKVLGFDNSMGFQTETSNRSNITRKNSQTSNQMSTRRIGVRPVVDKKSNPKLMNSDLIILKKIIDTNKYSKRSIVDFIKVNYKEQLIHMLMGLVNRRLSNIFERFKFIRDQPKPSMKQINLECNRKITNRLLNQPKVLVTELPIRKLQENGVEKFANRNNPSKVESFEQSEKCFSMQIEAKNNINQQFHENSLKNKTVRSNNLGLDFQLQKNQNTSTYKPTKSNQQVKEQPMHKLNENLSKSNQKTSDQSLHNVHESSLKPKIKELSLPKSVDIKQPTQEQSEQNLKAQLSVSKVQIFEKSSTSEINIEKLTFKENLQSRQSPSNKGSLNFFLKGFLKNTFGIDNEAIEIKERNSVHSSLDYQTIDKILIEPYQESFCNFNQKSPNLSISPDDYQTNGRENPQFSNLFSTIAENESSKFMSSKLKNVVSSRNEEVDVSKSKGSSRYHFSKYNESQSQKQQDSKLQKSRENNNDKKQKFEIQTDETESIKGYFSYNHNVENSKVNLSVFYSDSKLKETDSTNYLNSNELKNTAIFSIFEGQNDPNCSVFMSKKLNECIINKIKQNEDLTKSVKSLFLDLDAAFAAECSIKGQGVDSGTSVFSMIVHKNSLITVSLGNSRCLVSKHNCRETMELSVVHMLDTLDESSWILKAGGSLTRSKKTKNSSQITQQIVRNAFDLKEFKKNENENTLYEYGDWKINDRFITSRALGFPEDSKGFRGDYVLGKEPTIQRCGLEDIDFVFIGSSIIRQSDFFKTFKFQHNQCDL